MVNSVNLLAAKLSTGWIVGLSVGGAVLLAGLIVFFVCVPMKLWFRAAMSSAHVPMSKLIGMKMRKVDLSKIVLTYITARKAGLTITIDFPSPGDLPEPGIKRVSPTLRADSLLSEPPGKPQ